MPLINEDAFARLLKTPLRDHIFFLFGDDSYLKEVYAERLQKAVLKDDALKFFNYHVYEDDTTPFADIFADADILPVMTDKTCLLIRNYPLDSLGKDDLASFFTLLKQTPETSVLIFYYSSLNFTYNKYDSPKWCPIIETIRDIGVAVELSHRTEAKTVQMLMKGAAGRGTGIGAREAAYMIDVCGDDIGNLLNEFNKLCSYADGKPITVQMIDETVTKSVEASVFDISAMLFSGNADRAFAITYELLRQKTPVQSIIGALNQAYMTAYRYKIMKAGRRNLAEMLSDMGYKGDQTYQFRKTAAFADKCSMEKMRRSLNILIEADIKSKSTAAAPETLVTELIAELAAV